MRRIKRRKFARKSQGSRGRVLLLYYSSTDMRVDPWSGLTPVGLLWLGAAMRERGISFKILNLCGHSPGKARALLRDTLKRGAPSIIGATLYTFNRSETLGLLRYASEQRPESSIVLGGPHAVARARAIFERYRFVRGIVWGDGEAVISALADNRFSGAAGLITRENFGEAEPGMVEDLDDLPLPHKAGVDDYSERFITTARGCGWHCHYCSSSLIWGGVAPRLRKPVNVGREVRALARKGMWTLNIRDEGFAITGKRVLQICDEFRDTGIIWQCQSRPEHIDEKTAAAMAAAGCVCVQIGLETASSEARAFLGRAGDVQAVIHAAHACRAAGMMVSFYVITGIPGGTAKDTACTAKVISDAGVWDGVVSPLSVYPGTRLFDDMVRRDLVPEDIFEKNEGMRNLFAMEPKKGITEAAALKQAFEDQKPEQVRELKELIKAQSRHGFSPVTFIRQAMLLYRLGRIDEARELCLEVGDFWHSPHPASVMKAIGEKTGRGDMLRQGRGWLGKFSGFKQDKLWPAGEV